jgi:hypothetical protein
MIYVVIDDVIGAAWSSEMASLSNWPRSVVGHGWTDGRLSDMCMYILSIAAYLGRHVAAGSCWGRFLKLDLFSVKCRAC